MKLRFKYRAFYDAQAFDVNSINNPISIFSFIFQWVNLIQRLLPNNYVIAFQDIVNKNKKSSKFIKLTFEMQLQKLLQMQQFQLKKWNM